ncbi:hypothetical protein Vau01_030270 [Virgisporangium aurantiacum]|uniref:Uncharacterized protein n=1 Tax=Virgisporangium aurantiacum TaxID=175570 RepID=A0A8J4DZA3_9ACTN|nr:hypothetical protein Vau01_030270 [Virgisporangium aurantiacum]
MPVREPTPPTLGHTDRLAAISSIASPIAVVTALLVYYGWVRMNVQAEDLGYDVSVIDMSIQDYVLKTVNVLYIPLVLVCVLALAIHALHRWIVRRDKQLLRRLATALKYSFVGWVGLAVALMAGGMPMGGSELPIGITLSLMCALYGSVLVPPQDTSRRVRVLLLALLALVAFWDSERLARVMGHAYAESILADPSQLVGVIVHSEKDLSIDGVTPTRIDSPEAAYHFRYEDLHLLQRSGDRFLVVTDEWATGPRHVYVLRESDSVRIDFVRRNAG